MISENYQYLLGEHGPLKRVSHLSEEDKRSVIQKLPPETANFIVECGIGLWLNGRFQFCSPAKYQPIVDSILAGDLQFRPERTAMFGFSAFGVLMLWNHDHGVLEVDLPRLWATQTTIIEGSAPDISIMAHLGGIGEFDYGDWFEDDVEGTPLLFERIRKAHGDLELGEIYGFVPALEFGGRAHVESARRLKALEHMSILAQIGPVSLFDYTGGTQTFIRELGV